MKFRLHATLPASRANGPGKRFVVWFQGCPLRCPGCFNPETLPFDGGRETTTAAILRQLDRHLDGLEGVTFSGGEPFSQPQALATLINHARQRQLSTLIFTGHTLEALRRQPRYTTILQQTDLLVAGPYQANQHLGHSLLGSANQTLHFLTPRYRPEQLTEIPISELLISPEGIVTATGVDPCRQEEGRWGEPTATKGGPSPLGNSEGRAEVE